MSNKPLAKFKGPGRAGCSITIWEGEYGPTAQIQNQYKDKDSGDYKDSSYYQVNDLLNLKMAIDSAIKFMAAQKPKREE